jgi:hypothetical protein
MFKLITWTDTVDVFPHCFERHAALVCAAGLGTRSTTTILLAAQPKRKRSLSDSRYAALVPLLDPLLMSSRADAVQKRYLNRVIPNAGLVVAFYDYQEAETAVVRTKCISFR